LWYIENCLWYVENYLWYVETYLWYVENCLWYWILFVIYWILFVIYWTKFSFCHKLWCSNPYNFANHCRRPYIFQTINSVGSIILSLKYQRLTPSGCKDTGIRNFEFGAKTHSFICNILKSVSNLSVIYFQPNLGVVPVHCGWGYLRYTWETNHKFKE